MAKADTSSLIERLRRVEDATALRTLPVERHDDERDGQLSRWFPNDGTREKNERPERP